MTAKWICRRYLSETGRVFPALFQKRRIDMQKYITDCCFAGLKVSVHHNYDNLTKFLSDYLTSCPTDIEIDITTDDINHEKEKSDGIYPDYYLEFLAFLRKFCSRAADYGIVLFHSSAVVCDTERRQTLSQIRGRQTVCIRQSF